MLESWKGGTDMEYIAFGIIVGICCILFLYGKKKKKMDALLNFGLRMAAGTLGIYLVNQILQSVHISVQVGINFYNTLTLGVLGVPGFLLLYGISTYFMLK